jgi:hypothetical protein
MTTKLDLARQFVNLYGRLERTDRSLEIYQDSGRTYPSYSFVQQRHAEVSDLDVLVNRFRAEAPEHGSLADRLDADVRHLASSAGRMQSMADRHSTFGYGWGSTYDNTVSNVRSAIDVLLGNV